MFRRRPLTQYFKAVFLFLGISGSMVFSQQGNLSEVKIGVVDLVTATVLHPLMSLYDFGRNGFFRVPVGL
ncbi:hypothetical protein HYY75_08470, partial [bacterium]|nr:hypothetical protein [bacterium]